MVTDSIRDRRQRDHPNENERPDRGQIILIGAIALAFIILGVVVVFNGVLYTETLSSADTGQSASTAETTELEIRQGIGCIIEQASNENQVKDNITAFNETYQNSTAHSRPTAVNVELADDPLAPLSDIIYIGDNATVIITYDSNDLSYEQKRTIEAEECPS